MDPKKTRVLPVEDDHKPIIPQLVPVTIHWVETDRAYKTTAAFMLSMVGIAALCMWRGLDPESILRIVLAGMALLTFYRAYLRHEARKKLDDMKRRLNEIP